MAKNILAIIGLISLTLLIVAGISLMAFFYDYLGFVELPEQASTLSDRMLTIPEQLRPIGTPTIRVIDGIGEAQWENPLDLLSTANAAANAPSAADVSETAFAPMTATAPAIIFSTPTFPPTSTPLPTPTPTATPTPIPPMEPSMYRADTIDRLRAFANTLERWLELNKKMGGDMMVKNDPNWQAEMRMLLDEVVNSGYALDQIGPPPAEYATIDSWMTRLPGQVESLRGSYLRALETDDPAAFRKAGEDFNAIRETLTHAAAEMVEMGWTIE